MIYLLAPISPIPFRKKYPRQKRKVWKSEMGARADAPSPRGAGRRSSWHAIGAYDEVKSHHARGACEVSQCFCKNRFWRSTIETQESNSIPFCRFQNARRGAPRMEGGGFRALRARGVRGSENSDPKILEGVLRRSANLYVRLPRPPVRTHQSQSFLGDIVKRL